MQTQAYAGRMRYARTFQYPRWRQSCSQSLRYPRPAVGNEDSVCLSVCLFVCLSVKNRILPNALCKCFVRCHRGGRHLGLNLNRGGKERVFFISRLRLLVRRPGSSV